MKHNPELRNAVQYLYGEGVIRRDKDIVDRMSYSKGTVSSYIQGSQKASWEFLKQFEEKFNLKLENFKEGSTPGKEKTAQTVEPLSFATHTLIKVLATNRVILAALAELQAVQRNESIVKVLSDYSKAVEAEISASLDELKRNGHG